MICAGLLGFAFTVLGTGAILANEPALPFLTAEEFSESRVSEFAATFFSTNGLGQIIDGPRQAPDEPVDYSVLMSERVLLEDFLKSSQTCGGCDGGGFLFSDTDVKMANFASPDLSKLLLAWRVSEHTYDILEPSGLPTSKAGSFDEANIVFVFGDAEYLASKAHLTGDSSLRSYFEGFREGSMWEGTLSETTVLEGLPCSVTFEGPKGQEKVIVLTHSDYLASCMPKQLLLAIGLKPFRGSTPSALNLNHSYLRATAADLEFVKILRSDAFRAGKLTSKPFRNLGY
ncbi:hypothetical protein [Phaeobacter sp. 11ANDIMAR09]|uniref:hypothetical protein n=1 Tax=Phaeobacter sp. 11ANDIMAR09 TaxID=1225647 RepID=UPI0006C85506|nr:hypothetical protein [Phaeobacter sp. 11ANDIMAR09]KPD10512.1 hypothetical protein AN476_20625 [Phaeobacter sp. 11ANDIMAR09]